MPVSDSSGHLKITKELLLEIGGWRSMKEGRALWESAKVMEVHYEPPMLHGLVQAGTSSVKARLMVGKRLADVENLCSCRQAREYGTVCAHVIALGLEFIERQKQMLGTPPVNGNGNGNHAPALSSAPKQVHAHLPKILRVPLGEAGIASKRLALSVILPNDFAEAWARGEIKIACEGAIDEGAFKPLDALPRDGTDPYSMAEADLTLLQVVEKLNGGDAHSLWVLSQASFSEFFSILAGHPRVTLGKKTPLAVAKSSREGSSLHLDILPSGELQLHLEETTAPSGKLLSCPSGQWELNGQQLRQVNALPAGYHVLRDKDVILPRAQLAQFFQRELPMLEGLIQVVLTPRCGELQFSTVTPNVHVTLDGMLSGLSCRVEAVYPHRVYLLSGHPVEKPKTDDTWTPDPANPLRYFIRDRLAEHRARHEVVAAGFKPGERQPEFYTLASELKVGYFLANVLPRWRQKWKIDYTERMESFIGKCDFVEPEITITSSGEDWLSLDVEFKQPAGAGAAKISSSEVQRLLQTGVSHQRLSSGRIVLLPTQSVQQFNEVMHDCQVRQEDGSIQVNRRFASYLSEALKSNHFHVETQTEWAPPVSAEAVAEVEVGEKMEEIMRPYQKRGVNWLHYLARNGMGGILADEMGLGKTLQTLVYLDYRKRNKLVNAPFLIICPTSLVRNWVEECARYTPEISTLLLHGNKRQALFGQIPAHDMVITSYALMRRDVEMYQSMEFDTIVLDEAQHIKNRSSQNAQCAKSLKSRNRFILTGTPIENSLFDLWSMFDFLMPGYLGPASDFRDRYEVPISKFHEEGPHQRLRQRVQPFILRRTKAEVARDLPAKLEQVAFCELTDEQKQVYQMILDQSRKEVFESAGKNGNDQNRVAVLTALTRLRQVCCHLRLVPTLDDKTWNEPSAKMDYFLELLNQAMDGGHRILVFSQFVSLLRLVEAELRQRNITFCYLDGSTIDRQAEVQRFQNDATIPVFLISLKAGGTGLNLTGADTVIHFDPWWNPAVEEQATARAHRIGQSKIVSSYKLIARGTVEEKIVNLQQRKKDLITSTLVSEESFVQSLSWEELQGLLQ